jgi:ribosomal protein L11 methyltransferase
MSWLEVAVLVPSPEIAEEVASLIAAFSPQGVVIEATKIQYDPDSPGKPAGPYRVSGYLPQDACTEVTRQQVEASLLEYARRQPIPPAEFRPLPDANWVDTWKEHFRPIPIGRKLIVLPEWYENPEPARIPIRIDPGMAFGTGSHVSTQLALELLEEAAAAYTKPGVFDIGSGSGILAIGAAKLGAGQILGVDTDPEAEANARHNAALNGVAGVRFATASVAQILAGDFGDRQAELVLANILAPILIRLLDDGLGALVKPGGRLILSGIILEREAEVRAALDRHGFTTIARRQSGDWVALAVAH